MSKTSNVKMEIGDFLEKFKVNEDVIKRIDNMLREDEVDDTTVNIFYNNRKAAFAINADGYGKNPRKLIAIVYDRKSEQIIKYKVCEADNFSEAYKFLNGYMKSLISNIMEQAEDIFTEDILYLRDNKIYLRETDEVLIELDTQDDNINVKNLLNSIISNPEIQKIDGEKLPYCDNFSKIKDYIFISKEAAEAISENYRCDPKELFGIMAERDLIFTTVTSRKATSENRFSKRVRSKKISEMMGTEQLFGIRKDIIKEIVKDVVNE